LYRPLLLLLLLPQDCGLLLLQVLQCGAAASAAAAAGLAGILASS
jgi:hypothetical protein